MRQVVYGFDGLVVAPGRRATRVVVKVVQGGPVVLGGCHVITDLVGLVVEIRMVTRVEVNLCQGGMVVNGGCHVVNAVVLLVVDLVGLLVVIFVLQGVMELALRFTWMWAVVRS